MRRIHIPNLFFIIGQSYQGKSTLTRHFRQSLACEVVQTDQLFWRWCDKYHPKETRDVRMSLGRYFPYLSGALRREWFEYLTNYMLAATKYSKPDMVAEGWLLTLLPKDLKEILKHRCTIMNVEMRRYAAHTRNKIFRPDGADYTKVVVDLKERMQKDKSIDLMDRVKHQNFDGFRHCSGKSNCADRLAAFDLPMDLTGKTVLDIGCMTGYYSIHLAKRGAKVWAVDKDEDSVRLASRISNAIFRMPEIKYYIGDIITETFSKERKFDYVIVPGLGAHAAPETLVRRAVGFLNPTGQLIVEASLQRFDGANTNRDIVPYVREFKLKTSIVRCTNEKTLQAWTGGLPIVKRAKSVPLPSSLLMRTAYTFSAEVPDGLVHSDILSHSDLSAGPQEPLGLDSPVPEPNTVVSISRRTPSTRVVHDDSDYDGTEFEALSRLESSCRTS